MGGLHSLQSRLTGNSAISSNSVLPTGPVISGNGTLPTGPNLQSGPGLPGLSLPSSMQNDSVPTNLQGLHNSIPPSGLSVPNIPGLPGSLPNNIPSKPPLSNVDPLVDNPINNLLRQFASKPQAQQVRAYVYIESHLTFFFFTSGTHYGSRTNLLEINPIHNGSSNSKNYLYLFGIYSHRI